MSVHVRETAKGRRYDVKFRSPDGRQHSKTFRTRREAIEYEAKQITAIAEGQYLSERDGTVTVSELADAWMDSGTRRASSVKRDRSIVVGHVVPGFGPDRPIRTVTKADCQRLVATWIQSGAAARTVIRQHAVMRGMFQYAVDAELLLRNPASRLRMPQPDPVIRPNLTPKQLEHLAEVLGPVHGTFMWCGAILGLRWAETAGLKVSSVDLTGETLSVRAQLHRDGSLKGPFGFQRGETVARRSQLGRPA